MPLTNPDLDILERRARSALNGYSADVTITCYVYGTDVLALLEEVKKLNGENERLLKVAYPDRPHGSAR